MSWYKRAQVNALQEILNRWTSQGIVLSVFEGDDYLTLDSIIIPKRDRKQGIGTQIMQDLTSYADQVGKLFKLTPGVKGDYQGTTSRNRLVDFYKRNGFVQNKGRNKNFQYRADEMYRDPEEKDELV